MAPSRGPSRRNPDPVELTGRPDDLTTEFAQPSSTSMETSGLVVDHQDTRHPILLAKQRWLGLFSGLDKWPA